MIRIASLDDEIESRTEELESLEQVNDDDESTGTPEESSIETGSVDPTRFYNVRDKEDLEARILGKVGQCTVKERNGNEELVCDVELI
jgi:hypothetical protein